MATQLTDTDWPNWIASLMGAGPRRTLTAMLPPWQFHCLLDELPLHLVPANWLRRKHEFSGRALILNPDCIFLPAGQLPEELQPKHDLFDNFNLRAKIAWVRDPAMGTLNPFWLGPRLEAVVTQLGRGEQVPASVTAEARWLLAAAGIFVEANHHEQRLTQWDEIVSKGREQFRDKNYFPIANLIHPFQVAALRRYFRHEIRHGAIRLGDYQSALRYVAHNESVARFFHDQIAGMVSAIAGEPVKPSYVYLASYLSGAELKKHTDREQCEFSVTLCLDFAPEPELATPWPIRLQTPDGDVTVYQGLGDGLVYRGTKVPHYRSVLAQGCSSTSIFFHYVAADFSGSLN
jgi:hypothetical protein